QFLCSTCGISFPRQHDRREHMRADWHVYNLKRKVAELPPISSRVYDSVVQPAEVHSTAPECTPSDHEHEDSSNEGDLEQDEMAATTDCLFCLTASSSMKDNLDHMSACHAFTIPHLQHLETDLGTFLAYLALVICHFHACLYCGQEKHSAEAVRRHMLTKGHCMLNLSPDSDFLDFWNSGDDENLGTSQRLSDQELRLQSGAMVFSKHAKQNRIRPGRRSLLENSSRRRADRQVPSSSFRALAQRDQMGVIGLSDSQIRTLISAERTAMSAEFRSRDKAQWTRDRLGNKTKQKYFK
ncbi:uncharacterized protein MYCFIDRAFT_120848, partial [Pseudocercospora fijiensis CIRAD86]